MRCFPPWRRAYFLLFAQKKVAKEKGTPGSVPAAPVPCATRAWRGLRNSGCALRQCSPFSRQPLRCSAPLKGAQRHLGSTALPQIGLLRSTLKKGQKSKSRVPRQRASLLPLVSAPDGLPGPLRGAEQRRRAGCSRLALSEPQVSSCETPGPPSSARHPAGAPTQGWPSFWLLFLGHTRKSTPAGKAEHGASENMNARQARKPAHPKAHPRFRKSTKTTRAGTELAHQRNHQPRQ